MLQKISIYYDKRKHGDLKRLLTNLKSANEIYAGRSESEIARMLLQKVLNDKLVQSREGEAK